MAESTKTQWCDYTFNPLIGYSGDPIKWNKQQQIETMPCRPRVFCASLADIFEDIGERHAKLEPWRAELFELIDICQNVDWLILTKRPENIRQMWRCPRCYGTGTNGTWTKCLCADGQDAEFMRRSNVWLGTSVSDQETADKAIPELLESRDLASKLFISADPLLAPIDLEWKPKGDKPEGYTNSVLEDLDWIICGGESGQNARPCDAKWIEDIVSQCAEATVPCFVKQLGSNPVRAGLNLKKKGDDPEQWPPQLRVRQHPIPTLDFRG